jgi:peptide/nickel transport system substrate-binding protein
MVNDIPNLEGHVVQPVYTATLWNVYDLLLTYDAQQKPQPALAESFDVAADFKSLKLNLRKNVMWHNGREFDSSDVKWNIERVRDPKLGFAQLRNQSLWFTGIQTPDKYTVVLNTDVPRSAMFDFFEWINMLNKENMEGPDAGKKPIGTGPFKFVEWRNGAALNFTKNTGYWQNGRPYVNDYNVTVYGDEQGMYVALEAGAIDTAILPAAPALRDFVRLGQSPQYKALTAARSGNTTLVPFNTTYAPVDNKLVRQAVAYGLDKKRYIDTVLAGSVDQRSLPWGISSPAYDAVKDKTYTFDLDKARSLVQRSGVSNPTFDFVYAGTNSGLAQLGQIWQQDLEKIGIKMNLTGMDATAANATLQAVEYKGIYGTTGFSLGGFDPVSGLTNSRNFNYDANGSNYKNPRYSELVIASGSEPDAAKRKALYSELNDIMLEDLFVMVLCNNPRRAVMRANVMDYDWDGHDAPLIKSVWLA